VYTFSFSIFTLLIAISSIQFGASIAKQLFPMVGPIGATILRLCFASFILLVTCRPWRGKLNQKQIMAVSLYGASLGGMNLLFYLALERIPLGITVALEFMGPLTIALAASRRILDFFWALLAVVGILLILPISPTAGKFDLLGVFFAVAAGACWALYILFGQRVGNTLNSARATALGMLVATLLVLPVGLFFLPHTNRLLNVQIMPLAFLTGLLSSVLPYLLEMIALKRLPVKTFGVLMSLEPAVAALSGLVFLSEDLTLMQWTAIVCIIFASLGSSWMARSEVASQVTSPISS
jgi:inner membrane transporter RhtA